MHAHTLRLVPFDRQTQVVLMWNKSAAAVGASVQGCDQVHPLLALLGVLALQEVF